MDLEGHVGNATRAAPGHKDRPQTFLLQFLLRDDGSVTHSR